MINNYGFVYITINLINGKMYIGQHKHNCDDYRYIGSGKHFKNAVAKYGKDNFKRIIIEYAKTKKDLNECEEKWIWFFDAVNSDDFYNISKSSCGGYIYKKHPKGMLGKHHSIKKIKQQSELMKKLNKEGKTGAVWKNGHPKGMIGKRQTDNQKLKAGNGMIKIIYPDGKTTIHLSLNTASKETNIPRNVLRKIDEDKKPYKAPKNFLKTHSIYNGIMIERIS